MARIRSIKPEITLDEDLADLGFAARYFFLNLWCHCDREGRCEDRPKKLQALILPWDPEVDADTLLDELAPRFIIRYKVAGKRYIQVKKFLKHQRPHKTELQSEIPPSTDEKTENSRLATENSVGKGDGEGKGEGEGKGVMVPPEPKPRTPNQRVVEAYKHSKSVAMDDKAWDRANYGRYSKAAANLLTCFAQDVDKCAAYIFLRAQELDAIEATWTLETVVRHAFDGIGIPRKEDDHGPVLKPLGSDLLAGPGRTRRITSSREIAGDALRAIEHAALHPEKSPDLDGPEEDPGLHDQDFS